MISSGTTAIATSGDAPVIAVAIATEGTQHFKNFTIINEGSAPGFFSIDGGLNWCRISAASARTLDNVSVFDFGVQVKRVPGGTDMSGVYVDLN